MEAYTSFARVYDMFMDNVPYEVWGRYIVEKLRANGIDSGYVVDLGCGTGKLTTLLADAGYDMIGLTILLTCLIWRLRERMTESFI